MLIYLFLAWIKQTIAFQILEGVEKFSRLLQNQSEKRKNSLCSFWGDMPQASKESSYTEFLEQEILTDLTLLVGPKQVPIKVHKIILAADFDYFKTMFTCGMMESSQNVVRLPFVSPEDFNPILKYAYSGEVHLNTENVFKMSVLANYFGCKNILDRCCEFIKAFTNTENCVSLLETAFRLDINQLIKVFVQFVVDHPWILDTGKGRLSPLPVDVLIQIVQHPAAVLDKADSSESEKQLFHLIWKKVQVFPEVEKTKYIPKILRAVHLPVTDKHFLFFLLREFGHIPEARDLIMKAGEEIDPTETREWYLERHLINAHVKVRCQREKDKNGYFKYSTCVLIKGFPFYVYVSYSGHAFQEEYLHVESPVAIEHLGLPYEVIVFLRLDPQSEWISAKTYHNDR